MNRHQAKDLFQLQTELVDTKVDIAVSKAIDRILDSIADLKADLKGDIHRLDKHIIALDHRLIALDHRVLTLDHRLKSAEESITELKGIFGQIRKKFIAYSFRFFWVVGGALIIYALSQFPFLIKYSPFYV